MKNADFSVNKEIKKITELENPGVGDAAIKLPEAPQGGLLEIVGSEYENVVHKDGTIGGWNIGQREVALILKLSKESDSDSFARKNLSVTVPDHNCNYPERWFPVVENPNPKPGIIPSIQEWYGYEGNFTLEPNSKIVINDMARIDLDRVADNMIADVREISGITLTTVTGSKDDAGPHDIYIESLTDKGLYDLGDEGYLMVTDKDGLCIYAPTYIGCLYGSVTAEQILWQAKDYRSIPRGLMRDYPQYEVRGIMLDIARTPYRYQQLQDYAKIMLWYKMNEFHLHINDNDNCNNNFATMQTHAGYHRIESTTFKSLVSEVKSAGIPANLINKEYYLNNGDYKGNPSYTHDQWRELQDMCHDMGVYVLTEIDMPGHSLLYNKYAEENPDNIEWLEGGIINTSGRKGSIELLALTGENADRATKFAQMLWDEYTKGQDSVIRGKIVHIGADEYWDHSLGNEFVTFAENMRNIIVNNLGEDAKIRMWAAGRGMFSSAGDVSDKYQLDYWHPAYEKPTKRLKEGYQLVNVRDNILYGNPGRSQRDVVNAEYLLKAWDPINFGNGTFALRGDPNLLGAKSALWGDQSQEGMIERDINQRVLRNISVISEKTWGGVSEQGTFEEFELKASRLKEGPGTQIAMNIDSKSSLVLSYDFDNISADGINIYDASGNGYNATLDGGALVEEEGETYLKFDGSTVITTALRTLSYPYTVSFDLKLNAEEAAANTSESSLFSGYDGRLQVAGYNGNLSADVNYFTRDFSYFVPANDRKVNITLVGTFQGTKLYVDGELVTFLSQKEDSDGLAPGAIKTLYSSFVLPLEKIGEDFHGRMANLKVYNKALLPEIVAGEDQDGYVEVAQNTSASGDSDDYYATKYGDSADRRLNIAMKAIDGDGFDPRTEIEGVGNSEKNSMWQGYRSDSSLLVDLGTQREVSRVIVQWAYGGRGKDFNILTSHNGESWKTVATVTDNIPFITVIDLGVPVLTRYLKLQGVESQGGSGNIYLVQELQIFEKVDKAVLIAELERAEGIVDREGLSFESNDQVLFPAMVFARAMANSPLANKEEVARATDGLRTALNNVGPKVTTIVITGENGKSVIDKKAGSLQLSALVEPDSASDKTVTWAVYNTDGSQTDLATINESGLLTATAKSNGVVEAVAAAKDGSGVKGQLRVSISNQEGIEVTDISVIPGDGELTIQWSDPVCEDIKKIKLSGKKDTVMEAVYTDLGVEKITIIELENGVSYTFRISTIKTSGEESKGIVVSGTPRSSEEPTVPVARIAVTGEEGKTVIDKKGGSLQLMTVVEPDNATDKTVTWAVYNTDGSSTNLAVINERGLLTATAKADGVVEIIATAKDDSDVEGSLKVSIINQIEKIISVTGVSLNRNEATLYVDEAITLKATVHPANSTNNKVLWSSSNSGVASVTDGIVTAKTTGSAVISAITEDGNKMAQCKITVIRKSSEGGHKSRSRSKPKSKSETKPESRLQPKPESDSKPTAVKKTFNDIDSYPWAREAIEELASNGIINGTSENTFEPGKNVIRADFIMLLIRTLELETEIDTSFDDVETTDYYYNAIGIAKTLGIARGVKYNKFNPRDHISRQDMMVMTARALKVTQKNLADATLKDIEKFIDAGDISDYAVEAVATLVKEGIIQGSNSRINPKGTATRAEAAVIMHKIYNSIKP